MVFVHLKLSSMNTEDFAHSPAGRLVPTLANCMAFVPNPLPPPALDMARLIGPLEKAVRAVGELSGLGSTLRNPNLLIQPFSRTEAVASSRIEGTVTAVPELLMLERVPDAQVRSDTREVNNYKRALEYGLQRVATLPLSKRLFCELHAILLEGVSPHRGAHIAPGELKKDQNWIGGSTIQNARFVPPPPSQTLDALDALEKFIHAPGVLPLLIRVALVHYQFEAIHPFADGNGRVGRLIIPLMLCTEGAMSQPLLYMSAVFERNYDRYIDTMFEVSRTGAWDAWIEFFLACVQTASEGAIAAARALQDLHGTYMERVRAARSSALLAKLIDALFEIPALTIPLAAEKLGVSYNAAKSNVEKLIALGILVPDMGGGVFAKPRWYYSYEIVHLLDGAALQRR